MNLTTPSPVTAPHLHPSATVPSETERRTERSLHRALLIDGGGALPNALLILLAPSWTAELVGAPESFLVSVAVILLGYCLAIGRAAWTRPLRESLVLVVIVLNFLWVLGSFSSTGDLEMTQVGQTIWLGQTLFVVGITAVEILLLARLRAARKSSE